jgi:hypothetical protein
MERLGNSRGEVVDYPNAFVDVDCSRSISMLDALRVINRLGQVGSVVPQEGEFVADLRSPIMVRSAPRSSVKQNDEGIIEDAPLINNASGSTKLVADAVDEGSLTRVDAAKREKRLNRDQTETDTGGLSESHLDHWMATIGRTGL